MVRGQILSMKVLLELGKLPKERDEYIKRQLGLTECDLADIRSYEDPFDEIFEAAKIIYSKTDNPACITEYNLTFLINSGLASVSRKISKHYKEEIKKISNEYKLNPCPIQLLRCEITKRKLPFIEERRRWENFEPSKEDFQRFVELPIDVKKEEAELFGIYWGDASLYMEDKRYGLFLAGDVNDFPFYREIVGPRISKIHKISIGISEKKMEGSIEWESKKFGTKRKKYSYTRPEIKISSKAIVTWLKHDLGFPYPKINIDLPHLKTKEQKHGFFGGIIATMGSLRKDGSICVTEHDFDFATNIKNLVEHLGFTPRFYDQYTHVFVGKERKTYMLDFSPREVKRIDLINPKHSMLLS